MLLLLLILCKKTCSGAIIVEDPSATPIGFSPRIHRAEGKTGKLISSNSNDVVIEADYDNNNYNNRNDYE